MAAGGKMPRPHNGDRQLAAGQRVCQLLRILHARTLHIEPEMLRPLRDQRVIAAVAFGAVAVLIGPVRHLTSTPVKVETTIARAVGPQPATAIE